MVSVNTVAGDDILNNAEQAVAQIISGQVSGASPGDTVTVKLGTHVLTGIVLADGSWNVALDPAVTRTLDRGANTIFVTVTDAAGNLTAEIYKTRQTEKSIFYHRLLFLSVKQSGYLFRSSQCSIKKKFQV